MSYTDFVDEHVRISALRLLREQPRGRANESVLRGGLRDLGFDLSHARVRETLEWLKDNGLVTHEWYGTVMIAQLTVRGTDIADGNETIKGVHRPSPR
jgi:DNA-binding transcriptional ArsR family regulator